MQKNRINFITLGCYKNLVDSETLATFFKKNNIDVVFEEFPEKGDIAIINTCGFIESAKQESIDKILEYVELKEQGKIKDVYVIGCLSERYREELTKEIPEVNKFFGVNLKEILSYFKIDYKKELYGERLISTPKHYAYLKISEGCDRKCSFCAIPLIRGKHISRPTEEILKEARHLRETGVKELILIAQDTTYYGKDLYGEFKFAELLEKLAKDIDFEWIRVHYLYPMDYTERVLEVMAKYDNICNYVDIPYQHISDRILKSMRRGYDKDFVIKQIEKIRNILPNSALRTAFIVGYPGETQQEFDELIEFIRETKFDRLGVFDYSHEENTFAYEHYEDDIPEEIKQQRVEKIMEIQQEISLQKNQNKVGKTYKVLVDRKEGDFYIARTEFDSPEIDNEILIPAKQKLKTGEFYNVKITDAYEFDLVAELLNE